MLFLASMASICPPTFPSARTDSIPHSLNSRFSSSNSSTRRLGISHVRVSDPALCCRCVSSNTGGSDSASDDSWNWGFGLRETIRNAIKRIDECWSLFRLETEGASVVARDAEEQWDWERWMKHFVEVDDQERIVSVLKSQLATAIEREDYEDAARIKVAMAAATMNDTVGRVMSHMKKFVEEERYGNAALLRDYAATGLVGWWAEFSEDDSDPYGRIIHISAEYGRYVARSYSPRQLATASAGTPLFEVYLTNNKSGDYEQQAVYLKRKGSPQDLYAPFFMTPGSSRSFDSRDARNNKNKLFEKNTKDPEDGEDRDDDYSLNNVLRDMIPGVKVKVVKVTSPEKVNRDLISKVIEQIIDEDEEGKDYENIDTVDESKSENGEERSDLELDSGTRVSEDGEQNQIAVEFAIRDSFFQKMSRGTRSKDLLRVPARLEKRGRFSFKLTLEGNANEHISDGDGHVPQNKRAKLHGQRSIDHVMLDLVKSIGKGRVPMKVLKDVGDLITLSQAQNYQPLSGSTTFNRIDVSLSSDPLNGLYIGAHGLYTEVIHIKHKFGQWKEDESTKKPSRVEFYEYVEAVKITGDAYVPAGQVAFRAKVGKQYQLPHKGIIPEEFGVVARYRGQGRLAEPGFKNPRWVDGELVILDGKYIKGGPVVGFVYWDPEFHFLAFFNRLRLQD